MIAAGDKDTYPAAWAAHDYKTEGTSAGDWCLPAAGIFTFYYNNQDIINNAFNKVGGTPIDINGIYWSSTQDSFYFAWRTNFSASYRLAKYDKVNSGVIWPVIEF